MITIIYYELLTFRVKIKIMILILYQSYTNRLVITYIFSTNILFSSLMYFRYITRDLYLMSTVINYYYVNITIIFSIIIYFVHFILLIDFLLLTEFT